MAKLTKKQSNDHANAVALVTSAKPLTADEIDFVIDNWHEGATSLNTAASAIFSSSELAMHAALEVPKGRVLDLCAGIGTLAHAVHEHQKHNPGTLELVLVEINSDYAAVARRVLPEATVIVGSIYDAGLQAELAAMSIDTVISNPPFGNFAKPKDASGPHYHGAVHYEIIDIASTIADHGVFILPQSAVPFRYSGLSNRRLLRGQGDARYAQFAKQTGIELEMNLGIDCGKITCFKDVAITVEIAIADFVTARQRRAARNHSDAPLLAAMAA